MSEQMPIPYAILPVVAAMLGALLAHGLHVFRSRELAKTLQKLLSDRVSLLEELRSTTLKLEAALSANGDFEQSRNVAWDLYRRSSIGAGNAQAMLLRKLQESLGLLNKYRRESGESELKVPAEITDIVRDFKEEHVEKAKERAKSL